MITLSFPGSQKIRNNKSIASSLPLPKKIFSVPLIYVRVHTNPARRKNNRGFTLLETMVAVTLLTIAIVAPMSLTTQALGSAYYARDQITASYLAQEGIEAVRSVRDANILLNSVGSNVDLLTGLPATAYLGVPFTIDARDNTMNSCPAGGGSYICPPLQTDLTLYGYSAGWVTTQFTRSVTVCFVHVGSCNSTAGDEIKVTVTMTWTTGPLRTRTFTISENLYRWVNDGSASS